MIPKFLKATLLIFVINQWSFISKSLKYSGLPEEIENHWKYQQYTELNSNYKMPVVGLGTLQLQDEKFLVKAITEVGYRHIDTADDYGNDMMIKNAIKKVIDMGIPREELFITTKLWIDDYQDPLHALERILKNLDLDYVDLFLVHWPITQFDQDTQQFDRVPMHYVWGEMEKWNRMGYARSLGVSNFNAQLLADLLTYAEIKPVVNQIELHPYLQQPDLVRFCQESNITVQAFSPLSAPERPFGGKNFPSVLENEVIHEIAKKNDLTAAQVVLSWNISRGVVVLPKTTSLKRASENFMSQFFELSSEDIERINNIAEQVRIYDTKNWEDMNNIPLFA